MAEKYKNTQDQVNKEFAEMYKDMRDPDRQEQRELEANHKKNVERTAQRYGLD